MRKVTLATSVELRWRRLVTLSAGSTDQVDVTNGRHCPSVAVDHHLLDETVGRPGLTR